MLLLLFLLLIAQQAYSKCVSDSTARTEFNTSASTYGVIGQTAAAMKNWTTFDYTPNTDGVCEWVGTCFFTADCPAGYDSIRTFNGRCGTKIWARRCEPAGFGIACSNFFGVQKRFCCRKDSGDPTWNGLWRSSATDTKVECYYYNGDDLLEEEKLFLDDDYCGRLSCTRYEDFRSTISYSAHFEIGGENCTELRNANWTGIAEPGLMSFYDNDQQKVDAWYKYPTNVVKYGLFGRDRD